MRHIATGETALILICILSSLALRLLSYIFLRWIPGHRFPNLIYTAYAIYIASFTTLYYRIPTSDLVDKRSQLKITDPVPAIKSCTAEQHGHPLAHEATRATQAVIKKKSSPKYLRALLFGIPSQKSKILTLANLIVNTLLVIFTTDLIYRSEIFYPATELSFVRTGYVSQTTAKILVREPDSSKLPLFFAHRMEPESGDVSDPWVQSPPIQELTPATDYAIPVELHNLQPATKYRYRTSNNHTGTFHTAPATLNDLDSTLGYTSREKATKFTFLTSSCIKARVPYNLVDHPLHIQGFNILGDLLHKKTLTPDFMLFLGDFIYIDVPKRPSKNTPIVEGYRKHYRQIYSSPDWPAVSKNLPWIHVLDDHEISNDWSANTTGIYTDAIEPFHIYQHSVNPPPAHPGATYYTFNHGTASFFMLDTRRYRSYNFAPDGSEKSMLGEQQKADFIDWLRQDEAGIQWKIVVSSVPFTKNWRYNDEDTWAGFLHERRELLEEMWRVGAEGRGGVIVLSGDRHEFGATAFPPPQDSPSYEHVSAATVHEFSCSPLSQFYLPKRTYVQRDDEDVLIKYIPDGNSKFGAVEVDSASVAGKLAELKYRLFVDGIEVWNRVVTADLSRRGNNIEG